MYFKEREGGTLPGAADRWEEMRGSGTLDLGRWRSAPAFTGGQLPWRGRNTNLTMWPQQKGTGGQMAERSRQSFSQFYYKRQQR